MLTGSVAIVFGKCSKGGQKVYASKYKEDPIEQERPMGQGMMRGSSTPWAQGPANLGSCWRQAVPTFRGGVPPR